MKQFNYPTTIYFGEGSLEALAKSIAGMNLKKLLIVSDPTLLKLGMVQQVADICKAAGVDTASVNCAGGQAARTAASPSSVSCGVSELHSPVDTSASASNRSFGTRACASLRDTRSITR